MTNKNLNTMNKENNSILKNILKKREFGVFMALFLIGVIFTILTDSFLTVSNLLNMLRQTAVVGIMTMGMTMLITSQEFDLSVGSIYALSPVLFGVMIKRFGINVWISFILILFFAVILGSINGLITLKFGIPSFITTLGTMMFFRGVTLMVAEGWPISSLPASKFYSLFGGEYFGIPMQAFWFIIITIVAYIIFQRTKFGYKIFATGGNREAAELAGIKTSKVKLICFILTAVTATLAGITALSYLGSVSPTQGSGIEMEVIAASVIGGTALFGGSGSILGAFLGASIMGAIRNGLALMGTSAYIREGLLGLIIVSAVIVNVQYSRQNE